MIIKEKLINKKISEYANMISDKYNNENVILIGVLPGSMVLMNSLFFKLNPEYSMIDFIFVKKINNGKNVELKKWIKHDLSNLHVILITGIIDEGIKITFILDKLKKQPVKSIDVLSLVTRENSKRTKINNLHTLFNIKKEIVYGFGIGKNNKYFDFKRLHLDKN